MSQNKYIIKGNDIAYGIPSGATVPWGVLTSVKTKPSQNLSEFNDQEGEVGTIVLSQRKEVLTLEILRAAKKGQTVASMLKPEMGDVVHYLDRYYLVTSAEETAALNDAAKFSVELTWWPNIDLTPDQPAQASASAPETPAEDSEFPPAE
ncbi:MAG: hypothetical protein KHX31_06695 [Akkermansia sp.]|uniref:hypothetical protein n=1 Tax=Akkermansia sp. TaxID=1872421 RepID=UPI0025BE9761|nr:hypothetical protein [Akkermansia sp.]MBS5508306.1 hypothetical protein [Akkermansia sp.]